ncbi:dihydrodipicolinate synthase family protein [Georgenia sp. SUBG003]|uniref:dihydrodipicolinate synthase family protein n=1 Tax=Georgenia sp. SUBG003 TaxID=1497974 RepID=UPI000694899A
MNLTGIIAPVLTPFTEDGALDVEAFRAEVRLLLDSGVHGISPGGSTGEGAALTDDELVEMLAIIREENHDSVPVVAGIIRSSTPAAVRTGLLARDAGADALMVTPTFYNVLVPDDGGNRLFYQTLSREVGLPVIIYNVIPQNQISSELAAELLDIEHVVGIKQSVGGIMAMYDMRLASRDKGLVYAATDEMLASCYALGADGAISAILSLFPRTSVRMWELVRSGRHEEALALQERLYPVWRLVRGAQFPARMKAAASALGRQSGYPRSPLTPVSDQVRAALEEALTGISDIEAVAV